MRGAAYALVVVLGACHRREEPTTTAPDAAAPVAATSAPRVAPKKEATMTPEQKRVLAALRSGSGHRGEVRGTFDDLRRWIGPDAQSWPLPTMLKELEAAGEIDIHVLDLDAGANPAFVLSAWKD